MRRGSELSTNARFTLQLFATAAGTVLDIAAARFSDKPTWPLAIWAFVALLVATVFEFYKEKARDGYAGGGRRVPGRAVQGFFREVDDYKFGVIIKAAVAAAFAGLAVCALALTVITWRFLNMDHGQQLGKNSPFDAPVITFVSNFQTSSAVASLIVGTFVLAVVLKSEFVLPVGVLVASVVSAWQVPVATVGIGADGYRSPLAHSLSVPNGLLFRMPPLSMPLGCLITLAIGLAACGIVAACTSS